jgi:hypothetical protein
MRLHVRSVAFGLLVLFALAVKDADAAPCVAGPMSGLLGTSCSIGDLNFIFGSMASDTHSNGVSNPTTPDEVWFAPDLAPLNPGFILSGPFSLTSDVGFGPPDDYGVSLLRFELLLGIEPSLPDTAITGISASVIGVSASPGGRYAFAQAESSNWQTPFSGWATATEGYGSNGSYISNASHTGTIDPFWGQSCCGLVQLFALATNGGSVSVDAVSFNFAETHNLPRPPPKPVPEPATLSLLPIGAFALTSLRRVCRDPRRKA